MMWAVFLLYGLYCRNFNFITLLTQFITNNTRSSMKDMQLLEKFINDAPQNGLKLAEHMGYSSTNAIAQWKIRGSLPKIKRIKVLRFIERNTDGSSRQS